MSEVKTANLTRLNVNKKKEENKPVPKGAEIIKKDVSVDIRQIENGYIISRSTNINYRLKKDGYTEYYYDTKEYYSKEDPLEITTKDTALADLFDEE